MTNDNTNSEHDTTSDHTAPNTPESAAQEQAELDAQVVDAEQAAATDIEDEDAAFDPAMFAQVEEMMNKLQRAEELERELNDVKGKLARLMADFENYRRRTNQDVLDAQSAGVAKAAEALLPVLDDLTRALDAAQRDPQSIVGGVTSVRDGMLRTFERLGLTQTGQEGEVFDPALHEVLSVVPGDRDGVILQVYQPGFRLGDKLVRPARVVVMKDGH